MTRNSETSELEALTGAGLSLLPVDPSTKVAQVQEWGSLMDGTRRLDLDEIKSASGWACICGAASGGLEVIDIDDKHSADKETLRANIRGILQSVLGAGAGKVPVSQTQSGGIHIYLFVGGEDLKGNLKLARNKNRETVVETRGKGGYVLCPPSPGYKWLRPIGEKPFKVTPTQRDELYAQLRVLNEYEEAEVHRDHLPVSIASQGHRPGDEYNAKNTPVSFLEARGWTAKQAGDKILLRRPEKPSGWSATWNAIPGRLWVFSTNAAPFEDQKTYSAFEVYALLEHGGNFSKAAEALAAEGYGEVRGESIPVVIGPPEEQDEFPTMEGIIHEVALDYKRAYNIPYSAAALTAITCSSAAIGKSVSVVGASNHGNSYCNLYTLIPMPPSSGKSTLRHVWQAMINFNDDAVQEFEEKKPEVRSRIHELRSRIDSNKQELRKLTKGGGMENLAEIEVCRAELKKAEEELNEIAEPDGTPKPPPLIIFSNATSEGLADEMNRTPDQAIAALDTEAGDAINLMLGMHRQSGVADVDLYLSGWSCESRTTVRRRQRSVLREPLMTMLLAAQPGKVKEMITHTEVQRRGLLARFVICHDIPEPKERPKEGFPSLSDDIQKRWHKINKALLTNRFEGEPYDLPCTPEAKQIFHDFYNEDVRARSGDWVNFQWLLGKSEEQAIRLSGVLSVLMDHREVYPDTAILACKIVRWSLKSTVAALWKTDISETQDKAAEIVDYIKTKGSNQAAFSHVRKYLKLSEDEVRNTVKRCELLELVKGKFKGEVVKLKMNVGSNEQAI